MHISEGVLSAQVLLGGGALTAIGTAIGLKRLDHEQIVSVALLASAFFVASLIHMNVGPASVHLVMGGLLGAILGWSCFPAILVGLFLQSLLFQYGGLTVLGVTTFNIAAPAVLCFYLFRPLMRSTGLKQTIGGFLCGAVPVLLSSILVALSLVFTGEGFLHSAQILVAAHLPVMLIEGIVTSAAVPFLSKVQPELMQRVYS